MTNKADQVIAALPGLSRGELATVKAAVDFLINRGGPSDPFEERLFAALLGCLDTPIGLTFDHFKRTTGYRSSWVRHLPAIRGLLARFEGGLATPTAYPLQRLLWALLKADMASMGLPVTLGTMTSNMGRLPEVFNENFPGYLESGLASLIPKAMKRRRAKTQ